MTPRTRPRRLSVTVALVLMTATLPAAAQNVTVTTDQEIYPIGAIVEINVHNAGPDDAEFNSSPFIAIEHLDTYECIFGCIGLPVMTPLPAGTTHVQYWDTNQISDLPGRYRVTAHISMIAPPFDPPPSTEYTLVDPSPAEMRAWGGVKSLYR